MKLGKKTGVSKSVAATTLKKSGRNGTIHHAALKLLAEPSQSSDVRRLSRRYNLSNESVSRVTGASPRTVSYWNAGTPPQRSSVKKIREVTRLFDALAGIIKAKAIGDWLQRPNKQFDGSSPLQVIERGETDRLWQMIWQLREGNSG